MANGRKEGRTGARTRAWASPRKGEDADGGLRGQEVNQNWVPAEPWLPPGSREELPRVKKSEGVDASPEHMSGSSEEEMENEAERYRARHKHRHKFEIKISKILSGELRPSEVAWHLLEAMPHLRNY